MECYLGESLGRALLTLEENKCGWTAVEDFLSHCSAIPSLHRNGYITSASPHLAKIKHGRKLRVKKLTELFPLPNFQTKMGHGNVITGVDSF